jgi:hypothetical protein
MMKQLATQNTRPSLIAVVLCDSEGFVFMRRQVLQTIEVAKLANTISATGTAESQTSCISNTDRIISYLQSVNACYIALYHSDGMASVGTECKKVVPQLQFLETKPLQHTHNEVDGAPLMIPFTEDTYQFAVSMAIYDQGLLNSHGSVTAYITIVLNKDTAVFNYTDAQLKDANTKWSGSSRFGVSQTSHNCYNHGTHHISGTNGLHGLTDDMNIS